MSGNSELEDMSPGCRPGKFPYHSHRGIKFSDYIFADETIEPITNMTVYEDDVFIASYPKTGTTWTQEIVSVISNDCNFSISNTMDLDHRVPFLEFSTQNSEKLFTEHNYKRVVKMNRPRLIKTHLPYTFLPQQTLTVKPKIIYVYRNPKDTAVSFYRFHQQLPGFRRYDEWKYYLYDFLDGKNIAYGNFLNHVLSYWGERESYTNILFLRYEDMKKDLGKEIQRISNFLGKPINDEDVLEQFVQHCSFDNMSKIPAINRTEKLKRFLERDDLFQSIYFRKGIVGDWKSMFTVEQSDNLDAVYKKAMANTGLEFKYD